jgi:hypothetical protein
MKKRSWVGPFKIEQVLRHSTDDSFSQPPETGSAYLVSLGSWQGKPTKHCGPLYIGGTTGRSKRFRTRIGDLFADLFGFFGGGTAHHSGGQSLHNYCRENHIDPLHLYIGWVQMAECHRCLELDLYGTLGPKLNRRVPPKCPFTDAPHNKNR